MTVSKECLIVRNFGPLKEVELDLKKINLLIGPQGSGKSTLAKIISAIRSYDSLKSELVWYDLKAKLQDEYGLVNYFENNTEIIYDSGVVKVVINNSSGSGYLAEDSAPYDVPLLRSIYIPAERNLVPLISASSFLFIRHKVPIPKYITDFGLAFQNARKAISHIIFDFLDGVAYCYEDDMDRVILKNKKVLSLVESSNGLQTILPMLLVIRFMRNGFARSGSRKTASITIEEPELSIFPSTQRDLLHHIIESISRINYSLTITTHSPYCLTILNNLLYAHSVGNKTSKVGNIIPESLWIDPASVGAWYVESGTVRSILDPELQQINAEEIDIISDVLNEEYDNIMELKFK